jgi:chromate transporter
VGVLFAFLDAELVTRGLLTRTQLIDAIAVGQFTPGPVFSSVTFIGYQINCQVLLFHFSHLLPLLSL